MRPVDHHHQTRIESLTEVLINVGIGWGIGFVANLMVLPLFGYNVSVGDGAAISVVFTCIGVARGYIIRRWFNGPLVNFNKALAEKIRKVWA